jgi:hypothetical protein
MEVDWHDWIDLQMSMADIEAELPDMSGELPRIPTVGNAMGQRGLKGAIGGGGVARLVSGGDGPAGANSGAILRTLPSARL